VFVSGCLGLDPKTGNSVEGGVEAQTRQALHNLKGIVEASGSQVGKIVKTTVRTRDVPYCTYFNRLAQIGFPVRETRVDLMMLYASRSS
jgi:2-iminobutanoate/2-iminopropanoate deaminase